MIWVGGLNWAPCWGWIWVRGSEARIRIAANIVATPPSLFGMDRKIV